MPFTTLALANASDAKLKVLQDFRNTNENVLRVLSGSVHIFRATDTLPRQREGQQAGEAWAVNCYEGAAGQAEPGSIVVAVESYFEETGDNVQETCVVVMGNTLGAFVLRSPPFPCKIPFLSDDPHWDTGKTAEACVREWAGNDNDRVDRETQWVAEKTHRMLLALQTAFTSFRNVLSLEPLHVGQCTNNEINKGDAKNLLFLAASRPRGLRFLVDTMEEQVTYLQNSLLREHEGEDDENTVSGIVIAGMPGNGTALGVALAARLACPFLGLQAPGNLREPFGEGHYYESTGHGEGQFRCLSLESRAVEELQKDWGNVVLVTDHIDAGSDVMGALEVFENAAPWMPAVRMILSLRQNAKLSGMWANNLQQWNTRPGNTKRCKIVTCYE